MPVDFENYLYSYEIKGKKIFAPNGIGRGIGEYIKGQVEKNYEFDPFYYNFREGGHVAALHAHRANGFFCKVDIENFFYSISNNRIRRSLSKINIARAMHYAKWSCVRNPYAPPRHSLPYGFIQSPILASLVLALSPLGKFLRQVSQHATVSVYVDDIAISSNDTALLQDVYVSLQEYAANSNFTLNPAKNLPPATTAEIFNCQLSEGATLVTESRVNEFYRTKRSHESIAGFTQYRNHVEDGNE